jgi:hypothetical protein
MDTSTAQTALRKRDMAAAREGGAACSVWSVAAVTFLSGLSRISRPKGYPA